MKKICVLLNGPIRYDARVTKIIRTLSESALVDLFYVNGESSDREIFDANVQLHSFQHGSSCRSRLLRHTLFYREFDFLVSHVLATTCQYDLIYANDLPSLSPAVQLKRKLGAELVYDSHEIYIETLNQFLPTQSSMGKAQIFTALLWLMCCTGRRAEKRFLRSVDTFITASPFYAEYFRKVYSFKPIKVLLNCPPLAPGLPLPKVDFRQRYDWAREDTVALYQGILNKGRGLELLIDAMALTPTNLKLVIIGSGTLLPALSARTDRQGLSERVKFFGQVPQESLLNHTVAADFGVNLLEDFNLSKKLSSPNKLFEYMHAGIPMLGTASAENRRVFDEYEMGILVQNEVVQVAHGLMSLADTDRQTEFRENARRGAEKYNWQIQSKVILELLDRPSERCKDQ